MKKLLLGLISVAWCWAQSSPNSISQIITSASIASGGTVLIKSINNIGQNSHQLYAYTSEVAGTGCATGGYFAGQVYLQGSIDNVKWIQIGLPITNPLSFDTNDTPIVAFGIGLYPYLRVQFTNSSNSICKLTIWYTSSISPQAYSGSPRTLNDTFQFPNSGAILANTIGDTAIANASCTGASTGQTLVVYEVYIYNAGGVNTIKIK